jgi:hypothetical protein
VTLVWNQIRLTRAAPPGRAGTEDDRRRVYQAALQQSEELFTIASQAGPASRPLPLFYALSQAGRAIAAAYEPDDWVLRGHGLKADVREPITKTLVRPEGRGAFEVVSSVLLAPRLARPEEVGALWSSLPDLADTPLPDLEWDEALFFGQSDVGTIPRSTPIHGAIVFGWVPTNPDQIAEKLQHYPTARDGTIDSPPGVPPMRRPTPRGSGLLMLWPVRDEHGQIFREIGNIAPEYRYLGERWIRPALGSDDATLPPLMTWWALLFAFSILARYEPAIWVDALNLNESPIAVHVADALDEALEAVPQLVLEALTRRQHLHWRPIPGAIR